jgi:hypothetical protein
LKARVAEVPQDALYRQVSIQFAPALASPGLFKGDVLIRTNQPGSPEIAVRVLATIAGDFEAQPARLCLGFIGPHSRARAATTILVRSHDAPPLRPARRSNGPFDVALQRAANGRSYELTATANKALAPGRLESVIELRAGSHSLRIPISAYVDPSAS